MRHGWAAPYVYKVAVAINQSRYEHMRQLLLSATEAHGASTHRISIEIGDYTTMH